MRKSEFKKITEDTLKDIQHLYDLDYSINELVKLFDLSHRQIRRLHFMGKLNLHKNYLFENGKWKSIKKGHSEKTKKVLSEKRCRWLKENPDKAGYILCHKSRGESYPEKYFREWLEKENIFFEKEYQFKLYSFDFLVNNKIDLEIDGEQHHNDKKMKEHDRRRDEASSKAGFIVYRVDWRYYQRLSHEEKEDYLARLKIFFK